jgi:hypothetical protein
MVDAWAMTEQNRLTWLRYNQATLRAEVYQGLQDAVVAGDHDLEAVGKRIILPSSHMGSARNMQQLYQDSMGITRYFGKPDLFVTFTANPNWPEILDALLPGQRSSDRPDLVSPVFNLKLKSLLKDITKDGVLGKSVAHVYTIEFQKRGLPHAHILVFLDYDSKIRTVEDVDRVVCAELPDPVTHPLLYSTVSTKMMHGPCGISELFFSFQPDERRLIPLSPQTIQMPNV